MLHLSFLLLLFQHSYLFMSVYLIFFPFFIFFFFFFFPFYHIPKIQFSECTINLQCFTYHTCSFRSNIVTCSFLVCLIILSLHFIFNSITTQTQFSECTINLQCFIYHSCSFRANPLLCSILLCTPFFSLLFSYLKFTSQIQFSPRCNTNHIAKSFLHLFCYFCLFVLIIVEYYSIHCHQFIFSTNSSL